MTRMMFGRWVWEGCLCAAFAPAAIDIAAAEANTFRRDNFLSTIKRLLPERVQAIEPCGTELNNCEPQRQEPPSCSQAPGRLIFSALPEAQTRCSSSRSRAGSRRLAPASHPSETDFLQRQQAGYIRDRSLHKLPELPASHSVDPSRR